MRVVVVVVLAVLDIICCCDYYMSVCLCTGVSSNIIIGIKNAAFSRSIIIIMLNIIDY